jgi:acylphosphatase
MKHLDIHIYGRVQRVGYRYSAWCEANILSLNGFVKNLPDGSVYVEAEGSEEMLEVFLAWCRRGPDRAVVEQVLVEVGPLKNFNEFIIK